MTEIAVFIDDNQFGSGQSTMKCGPEAVSLFWHSTAPGTTNPYTAADVHQMAHDDYVRFIGPDTASDYMGTDNGTLYAMLAYHKFHYGAINGAMYLVNAFLRFGYPVVLGVTEASVFDLALSKSPYNWDTSGKSHIILATGVGNVGEVLVRDTANIGLEGVVRPGPRRYDAGRLSLLSATVVVPTWKSNPFVV